MLDVAGPDHVDDAVRTAVKAGVDWARTSPVERGRLLHVVADRVEDHAERLAVTTTRETGVPLADARADVASAVASLRQYAELGPLHRGRSLQGGWDSADLTVFEPRGVVAAITPWHDPVVAPCSLLAAGLVTGNTVVLKPSGRSPHAAGVLVELAEDVLPPGVLGLLVGDGSTGAALAGHADVDLVAHVGSTVAGRSVAAAAARTGAAVVLANGGKDALVVDADVDPYWAAEEAALGAFTHAGRIGTAVERIYVAEAVADEFLESLVRRAGELVVGPGLEAATQLGPLVDERLRASVHEQVRDAVADGATLLAGGVLPDGPGSFYPATVLADCTPSMTVMREETLGPVAPVSVVPDFESALEAARTGSYGRAAVVLTCSMAHAQRAWRELPVGTVKVNAVLGGAPGGAAQPRGANGSRFGEGPELLDEMTTTKVVHLASPPSDGC